MKISVNTLFAVAFMTLFMVATYDYLSTGFKSFNFVAGEQFKLKPTLFFEGAQAAVPKKPEDRITVVNVGNLSRGEIGDQIRNIIQFKPKVIGIDICISSIDDAIKNAKLNNIKNCEFICNKIEDVFDKLLETYKPLNKFIIVDPPRSGLHGNMTKLINESKCNYVIYVFLLFLHSMLRYIYGQTPYFFITKCLGT